MTSYGAKSARIIALALLLATNLSAAHAATLRVGPQEKITRIADAAQLARDGDTVEIQPGEYRGDVAVWEQKQLTIRGIGPRPVLIADGKNAEGKAIWVIRNGDIRIENSRFTDAPRQMHALPHLLYVGRIAAQLENNQTRGLGIFTPDILQTLQH